MGSKNSKDKHLKGKWPSSSSVHLRVLLLWTARFSPLHSKLSLITLRDICSYFGEVPTLMAMLPSEIQCFDLVTKQWLRPHPLQASIRVNFSSSATFISDGQLFLCGGGEIKPCTFHTGHCAYTVEANGAVQVLPNMLKGRMYHGIICGLAAEAVYVFGGWDKKHEGIRMTLRCCEQFKYNKWSALPDMQYSRFRFNPCWYRSVVYLCGGRTTSVEIYNPRVNTFVLMSFSLPEDSSCAAVVDEGKLVAISYNYISKLQYGEFTSQMHSSYRPQSICTPAVVLGTAYLVCDFDSCCREIDLTTGAVTKEVKFSLSYDLKKSG